GGVGRVGGGDGRDDPAVRRAVGPVDDAAARVRTVDDPVPAGGEQRGDERLAVCRDGAVVRAGAVALPGRRVQHDQAVVRRVGQGAGVVVCLGPADLDRAAVDVV